MADTNTYTSKQNIKKYTTQAKFDAIDKSDVPVGTEYNIVGAIAESDLDSDLQAKVNSPTPVDQTYSATSENAQSGKAVAGALSSKQDKITNQSELTARSLTTIKDIICENNLKGRYLFTSNTNMGSPSNTAFLIFEYGQSGNVKSTMRLQTFANMDKNIIVNFPNESGTVVYTKNLKTIFGNQSIVGTGNIDLYKHHITLTGTASGDFVNTELWFNFYSSNNLAASSLTDLKTLLGETFREPVYGKIQQGTHSGMPNYISETQVMYMNIIGGALGNVSIPYSDLTITDTVTAI